MECREKVSELQKQTTTLEAGVTIFDTIMKEIEQARQDMHHRKKHQSKNIHKMFFVYILQKNLNIYFFCCIVINWREGTR